MSICRRKILYSHIVSICCRKLKVLSYKYFQYSFNRRKNFCSLQGFIYIIHQVIDFLYTTANFKWPLLMEYSFGLYTIVAGVIAVLFYIQTGLIYQIIRDWIKKDLAALLITLGLNFVQYVLIKYSIVKCWIMGKDLFVAFDFFSGNCDLYVILFTIIRSLLFSICLYLINQVLFEKKDIIRYEK